MPPSADDIENKRFLTALRGYDKDQVHAYLQEVATRVRALEDELAALRSADGEADAAAERATLLRRAAAAADEMLKDAAESAHAIRESRVASHAADEQKRPAGLLSWWISSRKQWNSPG